MSGPPDRWRRLLARVLPEDDRAAVLSALDELYRIRVASDNAAVAARWYRRQVRAFAVARLTGRWRVGVRVDEESRARSESLSDWLRQDARYAWRQLTRHPTTTLVALVVLALGVGASTAVFSVVDGVVLAPLPYADSERLVRVQEVMQDGARVGLAPPAYRLFGRSELSTLESVAVATPGGVDLEGVGEPEHLTVAHVSGEFFDVVRARAALGRTFVPDEDRVGGPAVAVLSHDLWVRRFGGDPSIVGRAIRLGGTTRTVLGVMPRGFDLPAGAAAWLPVTGELAGMEDVWGALFLEGIGRLREGADPQAATAELSELLRGVPDARGFTAIATSLHEELTAEVRRPLLLLLGAVVLMLLVACANVGGLLLARALERRRELALRTALGATRRRLTFGLLIEGILLGLAAGAAGIALAALLVDALLLVAPGDLPRAREAVVNGRTLLFALGATLLTGVLVGLLPATQIGPRVGAAIREGALTHTASVRGARTRGALVVAQTAVTVVLLAGAGLLVVSFLRLMRQETGFDPRGVVALDLSLPTHRYASEADLLAFYDVILDRVRQTAGIEQAAVTRNLPMGGRNLTAPVHVPDGRKVAATVHVSATPGYLELMRTRIIRGRPYETADVAAGRRPVVLSETLARGLFGDEDSLGRRIVTAFGSDTMEVVGVAQDVRFTSLSEDPQPVLYRPLAHWSSRGVHIVVRSPRPAADLFPALRAAIHTVSPGQPVRDMAAMPALLARTAARPRFYALLLTGFASMALVLSTLGLYGLLLNDVTRQRREIGIRMALGARVEQIAARIVGRGIALTSAGAALGVAAALATARLLEGLLFQVRARDPATLATVVLVLIGVSLLATLPAVLRVTRVHPGRELAD